MAIFLGGVLCACSALSPDAGVMPQPRSAQPPRNYRQTIADGSINFRANTGKTKADTGMTEEVPKQRSFSTVAEVSSLRETQGAQLGDWMACLRISKPAGVTYIAIFFEDEKILDYRTAIMMDRCEGETYGPLPPRSPSPKKEDQPQKKRLRAF